MTHVQKHTAQLLKEKEFDLSVTHLYHTNKPLLIDTGSSQNWNEFNEGYSAPELYKVPIWLRTKGVHVYVSTKDVKWAYTIEDIKIGKILSNSFWHFDTHDLALESAIVHALKQYVK